MSGGAVPLLLPRKILLVLAFVLAVMWYAGASQNNAAAYLLFFVLGGILLVSIPHTILNLSGLRATAESVKPTFVGQEISLPVEIINESGATRHAIGVSLPKSDAVPEVVDAILPGKAARVVLRFPADRRGEHAVGMLSVGSVYPLGFLRATRQVPGSQRYLVYPEPAGDTTLPMANEMGAPALARSDFGEGDEFAGVRAYVPGESQRHIDWKAVARGQPMMTKQFATESHGRLFLDFDAIPARDAEARLSQLALWIIEAERARRPYGLRLPGTKIPPSLGDAHFHRCLRTLALFG